MEEVYDITIVGGGILGVSIAYKLQLQFPEKSILVLEKERELALHQTGNNSGVIHSGLYYKEGSLKARLCKDGRNQLIEFAKKFGVPHDVCGKVIVATREEELSNLNNIYNNGIANGCEGIVKISSDQIKDVEPFCEGISGIWVPGTGIIDYKKLTEVISEQFLQAGETSSIKYDTEVSDFDEQDEVITIKSNQGNYKTKKLICCTGLFADRMARKDQLAKKVKIVPFRGDYYDLTETGLHKVKNLIYPVPDPSFPFLGVHFTRMIGGGVECGPNAVFSFKREGYKRNDFNFEDTIESLLFPGLWKLFGKYWKQGIEEYKRAWSKELFLRSLQSLIPSLVESDIKPARSGVRAQALDSSGNLIYDFKIERKGNHFHILNAPSPAATACLAIADHVVNKIVQNTV